MIRHLSSVACLLLLGGCETMIQRSSRSAQTDNSAPTATVALLEPSRLGARYEGGERITGVIDPARRFDIVLRQDTQKVYLVFAGHDPESGVAHVSWSLSVDFSCQNEDGVVGRHVNLPINGYYHPPRPDIEAPRDGPALAEFDLQTLWERGGCRDWGAGEHNLTRGYVGDFDRRFTVEYQVQAWNNASPRSINSPILRGSFRGIDAALIEVPAQTR